MNNRRQLWKDEWAIFIIAGLIIGFLIGKFAPEISRWMKKEPAIENQSSPTVVKTNEPLITQLSKGQILAQAQKNKNKVVVIGIDGATWHVIMPLVNAGKMPNMAKLMNEGVYGNLKSMEPSISPVIWTTIATGKEPTQHGIEGFIVKMPGGYEILPVTSDMRKVKAIWNILSDYEKKVGVISWWVTRPPEKVNGFMVSDGFRMHRFTYPDNLSKEIESKLENSEKWFSKESKFYTPFTYDPNYEKKYELDSPEYFHHFVMKYLHDFTLKDYYTMTAFRELYSKEKPDFLGIYFPSVDALSHFAWKYMEPKSLNEIYDVTDREKKNFGDIIPKVYQKVDQYIGEILQKLPPDTIVMVISDHGFEAHRPDSFFKWINLNKLLNNVGLLEYTANKEIDWAKTKVYELEDLTRTERVFYLNLKGREPNGIIDPKEYDKVRQSIAEQLKSLKTVEGTPLFMEVKLSPGSKQYIDSTSYQYMKDFYYGGVAKYTGDIYVIINPKLTHEDAIEINGKKIPLTEFLTSYPLSGNHEIEGIVIMAGNPIQKSQIIQDAQVLDVAPTVLYLMGLPIPQDMPGKVIKQAITSQYLSDHPILYIPTYETEPWKPKKSVRNPEEEKEFFERMQGLQYIDTSPGHSKATTSHR